jgi:hypothetical protein
MMICTPLPALRDMRWPFSFISLTVIGCAPGSPNVNKKERRGSSRTPTDRVTLIPNRYGVAALSMLRLRRAAPPFGTRMAPGAVSRLRLGFRLGPFDSLRTLSAKTGGVNIE